MLRELGLTTFKIASSESGHDWWQPRNISRPFGERWFVSYPWGQTEAGIGGVSSDIHLTAIPLYPTPLECVGRATLLEGYSCHAVGNDACFWALAQGAKVIEVHFTIGRGRVCAWDRTPEQVRELRRFASAVETMTSGVSQQFRERWKHGA
jgi:hypothetical protein